MKKTVVLTLSLIVIIALLSACGEQPAPAGADPVWTTGTTEQTEKAAETTEGTIPEITEDTKAAGETTGETVKSTTEDATVDTTVPQDTTESTPEETSQATIITVSVPEADDENALPWG